MTSTPLSSMMMSSQVFKEPVVKLSYGNGDIRPSLTVKCDSDPKRQISVLFQRANDKSCHVENEFDSLQCKNKSAQSHHLIRMNKALRAAYRTDYDSPSCGFVSETKNSTLPWSPEILHENQGIDAFRLPVAVYC